MQIHELDNYSGALDSSAYLAIDDGNNTGKISSEEYLSDLNQEVRDLGISLNTRIDNIIAGGTAPSEAEVVDARKGYNDYVYASLGDAIRSNGEALEYLSALSLAESPGMIGTAGDIYPQSETVLEKHTEKIQVVPGMKLRFTLVLAERKSIFVAFGSYDSSGNWLGRTSVGNVTEKQFEAIITVPANTYSIVIGYYSWGATADIYAFHNVHDLYINGSTDEQKIAENASNILNNNLILYSIGAGTLLTESGFLNQRGQFNANQWYRTTDYIQVKAGQQIKYKLNSNTTTAVICLYSDRSESSFVSYVAGTASLSEGVFTPSADGYIRFSTLASDVPASYCYIEAEPSPNFAKNNDKIFSGKKVVVFGDSIMADSSCAAVIESLTGATVYNCAIGGTLLAHSNDNYDIICGARIAQAIENETLDEIDVSGLGLSYTNTQHWNTLIGLDFSDIDIAVVSYGTNDFAFNVPITSETAFDESAMTTAAAYFIKALNTKYPNIQLCFFTPSYRQRTAWSGDSDEVTNSIGKYLVDYENAIVSACEANHIPCKAMYKTCGVNKYNYATYLSDGVHRTAAGGELLGHQYAGFLEDNVI